MRRGDRFLARLERAANVVAAAHQHPPTIGTALEHGDQIAAIVKPTKRRRLPPQGAVLRLGPGR